MKKHGKRANALADMQFVDTNGVTYRYFELPDSGHDLGNNPVLIEESTEVLMEYANKYLK